MTVSTIPRRTGIYDVPFVSVTEARFGAKGTGLTDDSTAINAALASGAKIIQFPAGTYRIDSQLLLDSSGITLYSEQGAVIKHKESASAGFYALRIRGSNTSVIGITFDGNSASPPLSGTNEFIRLDTNGGTLDNVRLHQNRFQNLDGYGVASFAAGTLSNLSIVGNHFENFIATGNQACMQLGGAVGPQKVEQVQVEGNSWHAVNGAGISIRSDNGVGTVDQVSVTNNIYEAGTSAYTTIGVEIWNAKNLAVAGNTFLSGRMGLSTSGDQIAVSGNTFEDMGSYCIEAGQVNGFACSGNTFKDFQYGMIFYNGAADISVAGNTFRSAKAAATTALNLGWAVQFSTNPALTGPYKRFSFTGNTLYDCSGVRMTRVQDAVLSDNVLETISTDHLCRIQLSDALMDGVTVAGNRLRTSVDIGATGLIMLNGSRLKVRGNTLVSTTGAANTGPAIGNVSGSTVSDVDLEDNYAENFTHIANLSQAPSSSTRIRAKDNRALNCTAEYSLPSTASQKMEAPSGGLSDNGDSDLTLTGRSNRIIRFTASLTANRAITLDTATAWQGQEFEVTRIAGGAFTLSVGGLVNLAKWEWCKVVYNGSAWVLTEFGQVAGTSGAAVQGTSKATGVTLNNYRGQITTHAEALAANTAASFTFTNSRIAADDMVLVWRKSGGTALSYDVYVDSVAAGSCVIVVKNTTAGPLSEALVLGYEVRPCSL
jgi:hypothetical protein